MSLFRITEILKFRMSKILTPEKRVILDGYVFPFFSDENFRPNKTVGTLYNNSNANV